MKCMRKDGMVQRVSNESAAALHTQGWVYISKSEYKASLRDKARKAGAKEATN